MGQYRLKILAKSRAFRKNINGHIGGLSIEGGRERGGSNLLHTDIERLKGGPQLEGHLI